MPTNDPNEIVETKFSDAKGFTAEQRTAIVEKAKEISKRDFGQGIAIMPPESVDSLLALAATEIAQAAKIKGAAQWTEKELEFIRDAKATFSKKAVAEGAPGKRRAEFIAKHGLAAYEAERAKWSATTDVRQPGVNPYKNIKGLKKALRGEKLAATEFNLALHADQVAKPPKAKLTPEQKSSNPFLAQNWSVTNQGKLFKLDPGLAASMAASAGVRIGATRPVR